MQRALYDVPYVMFIAVCDVYSSHLMPYVMFIAVCDVYLLAIFLLHDEYMHQI